MTKLLAPKLIASRAESFTPRVVYVSSGAHFVVADKIDWNTLRRGKPAEEAATGEEQMRRYGEVNAMSALCAAELSRRANGKLHAYSLHPGSECSFLFAHLTVLTLPSDRNESTRQRAWHRDGPDIPSHR